MRSKIGWGTLLCVLVGWAASVSAEMRSVSVTGHDYITGPEGEQRVLLKFGDLPSLEDVAIGKVLLRAALPATVPEDLELRFYPILTNWSPGAVDWTTSWSVPGGDIEEVLYGRLSLASREGRSGFEVDLTSLLISLQDESPWYGLLVAPPVERAEGVPATFRAALETVLANATLEIQYRVSKRPPSRT